ncbi:agamous-like MADS-box protein AGL66 [Capsicum chacoense]
MGRKIEMKKIEEITKRQVTFSKRRSNLMKKAKEIDICCDVDVLFVAFSPSGRLSKFSSKKSIEDTLQRYINLPVERRFSHMIDIQEKVAKLKQLNHIRGDVSKLHFLDKQFGSLFIIRNLELQIKKGTLGLQILDANIRNYKPGAEQESSLHQLCWCESNLKLSLEKVMARKKELETQEKMDLQFAAQQTAPQQFDNWVNPYSATMQENIFQNWFDKGKSVSGGSSNYTYNVASFASSSQSGNISFSQIQNPSPYIPLQCHQQNMIVDVQQNPTQIFEQSQAQVTFGESNGNSSIMNIWNDVCTSTRPILSPISTMGIQLNNASQLGLEYAHSNLNINLNHNNNNNNTIQHNDHNITTTVQNDERAPNESNNTMEENTKQTSEYFVESANDNDAWEWDNDFLNEAFSGEDFRNMDSSSNDK